MPDTAHEWISRAEAARILGMSERTVDRWAAKQRFRILDRPGQRGKLYHRSDVEALAAELGSSDTARSRTTAPDVLPASELLQVLQETQARLERAMLEVGRLQGQLEAQQRLLTAHDTDRQRLTAVEKERDALKRELEQLREHPEPAPHIEEQPAAEEQPIDQPEQEPKLRRTLLKRFLQTLGIRE